MESKQLEVKQDGLESVQLMEQVRLTQNAFDSFMRNGDCIVETYEQLVGVIALIHENDDGTEITLVHHGVNTYTICIK
ncbi:hypothetical protein PBC5_079 [Bacillus phage PBC5]|nr:hypothetical protein PBC5_079 [Bacillus phage PBC5]